jgi:hypothetical protein
MAQRLFGERERKEETKRELGRETGVTQFAKNLNELVKQLDEEEERAREEAKLAREKRERERSQSWN